MEVDANASLGTMPVLDDAIGGEEGGGALGRQARSRRFQGRRDLARIKIWRLH
jgi:hypothetical protein